MKNTVNDTKSSEDSVDRLTFWRNWYTGARQLPDDLRLAWLDAVLDFAFAGVEPSPAEGGATAAAAIRYQAVSMVRATIEISRKRKFFGSKGGSTRSKTEAKPKQKPSNRQADRNQVKEQVQEQEQEHNANSITATRTREASARFSLEQFIAAGSTAGVPADFCRERWLDLEARGWLDENGRRTLTSPRSYLKSAWNGEQKKIRAARLSGDDEFGGIRVG